MTQTPHDPPALPLDTNLNHIADLLRCASASAYESGDSLNGTKRDLAFSVVHLIEMARTRLAQSLSDLERC